MNDYQLNFFTWMNNINIPINPVEMCVECWGSIPTRRWLLLPLASFKTTQWYKPDVIRLIFLCICLWSQPKSQLNCYIRGRCGEPTAILTRKKYPTNCCKIPRFHFFYFLAIFSWFCANKYGTIVNCLWTALLLEFLRLQTSRGNNV